MMATCQTQISQNNNKFYVLQLLEQWGSFYTWTRWGRVGERGQSNLSGPSSLGVAEQEFKKKFRDKTKNAWENRDNFVAHAGKYTMLDMADDDGSEDAAAASVSVLAPSIVPSMH